MQVSSIFYNYETIKLDIANPDLSNILILLLFLSIIIFSRKECKSEFLDRTQTDQLKGIAIFFVILGHLWVHVSGKMPAILFSSEAVGLFFFLSGYGLTISNQKKIINLKDYLNRRLKRVMIPYWIATIFILFIDYIILDRTYDITDILSTLSGYNVTTVTRHIDYVRWYITLLLIWYIAFYIFRNYLNNCSKEIISLFTVASFLFITDYYIFHFGWYQVFLFPFGCLVGSKKKILERKLAKNINLVTTGALATIILYIYYKVNIADSLSTPIPWIVFKFASEILTVVFTLCCIIFIAIYGNKYGKNRFLYTLGAVSYELFLLHGAFLIKYNPIVTSSYAIFVSFQFYVFLLLIILISLFFKKLNSKLI